LRSGRTLYSSSQGRRFEYCLHGWRDITKIFNLKLSSSPNIHLNKPAHFETPPPYCAKANIPLDYKEVSGGCAVVDHSTHHPKVMGLSTAATTGEKLQKIFDFFKLKTFQLSKHSSE
jgi:hypothetical protein